MVRTVAVINQKGGCGKTTTAINLSAVAAADNQRVLLIDLDPQSHCAAGLAVPESRIERHVGDLLLRDLSHPPTLSEWVWQIRSGVDLIPSTMALAGLEAPGRGLNLLADRDRRLLRLVETISDQYDWCILDCSPSVGLLTFNALRAATNVVIPVETSFFALQGAEKQVQTIETLQRRLGIDIPYALLPTLFDDRVRLSREILDQLKKNYGEQLVDRPIRYCTRLREAASFGQSIIEYDSEAESSNDYRALYRWLGAYLPAVTNRETRSETATLTGDSWKTSSTTPQVDSSGYGEGQGNDNSALRPSTSATGQTGEGSPLHRRSTNPLAPDGPTHARVGIRSHADSSSFVEGHVAINTAQGGNRVPSTRPGARAAELAERTRTRGSRPGEMSQPTAESLLHRPTHGTPSTYLSQSEEEFDRPARPAVLEQAKRFSGARQTRQGVLFVYPGLSPDQNIAVAGDFNDWSMTAHPMMFNDRLQIFETCLDLRPGRHEFQFYVDGRPAEKVENTTPTQTDNLHDPQVIDVVPIGL